MKRAGIGSYSVETPPLEAGHTYEYRAVVRHPLLTLYGAEKQFKASAQK